ncbi:MAG: tetratricopeptide repeat protein [Deltaproteobacteria bacterium]|nr:tetratricopeptide repeat protein [Deltaproteobacteria bacterium]
MRELEGLLQRDPTCVRFSELADVYTRVGRFKEAIQYCKQGLSHHPHDADGYLSLGRALFGMNRLAVASEALQRAIGFRPSKTEAYRLLAEVLVRRGLVEEAIKTLEDALQKGGEDSHISRLLERANAALDVEQTRVTGAPRGMGNQAIAGTIGGTQRADFGIFEGEPDPADSDEDILRSLNRGPRREGAELAMEAFSEAAAQDGKPSESKDWRAIGNQWEQYLDAQGDGRLLTDPDVPIGKITGFSPPPLSDPMAEGMPPLPEETCELVLPEADPSNPDFQDPDPGNPDAYLHDSTTLEDTDAGGKQPVDDVSDTLDMAPEGHFEPDISELGDTLSDRGPELAEPVGVGPEAGDESGEIAAPSDAPGHAEPFEQFVFGDLGEEPPSAEVTAERSMPNAPFSDEGAATSHKGRVGRVMLVLVLIVLFAAGGFFGWKTYQREKGSDEAAKILEQGVRSGTRQALEGARKALSGLTHVRRQERQAGIRLLNALQALWHGAGGGQTSSAKAKTGWLSAAANAVAMLSAGNVDRVALALGAAPGEKEPLAWLHPLLSACVAERRGHYQQVVDRIGAALSQAPQALPALLMRGRTWLILGAYVQAEDDFRQVIAKEPTHAWARVGLAAALVRRGRVAELGELLEGVSSLELAGMADLVRAELFERPNVLKLPESRAPLTVLTLTYAIRALGARCEFAKARQLIEKVRLNHPQTAALVGQLRGELALAEGLDRQAVELLGKKVVSPVQLRLRAWAQLLIGQPDRVLGLLKADRSDAALPLHLVSGALQLLKDSSNKEGRRKPAISALESLAEHSLQARMGLAMVLVQMKQKDRALAVLKKGGLRSAADRARAATFGAGLLAKRDPESALSQLRKASPLTLKSATAGKLQCDRYAPALALAGELHLESGDLKQAQQLFLAAKRAGLSTPSVLEGAARAALALGRTKPAVKVLAEKKLSVEGAALLAAELALTRDDLKRARKLVRALQPSCRRLVVRARVAIAKGRSALGRRILAKGRARYPHNLSLMRVLGEDLARAKGETLRKKGRALLWRCAELASKRELGKSVGAQAALVLARFAFNEDKIPRAMRTLAVAEKLDGTLAAVPRVRGEILYASEHDARARKALERAVQLDPRDARAYLLLGRACVALRDRKCAKKALKSAVEFAPRGAAGRQAARELAKLR